MAENPGIKHVGIIQTNRHGEVMSVQDSWCILGQVVFVVRTTEVKWSIMRWKILHSSEIMRSCCPRKAGYPHSCSWDRD
jgi:hypothetical protein